MAYIQQGTTQVYVGVAADTKPTGVPAGSEVWELDTEKRYKTKDGTTWVEISAIGG